MRSPRRRHVKQPRLFLLVLARSGHVADAGQGDHWKLQPFADVHGQHGDGVAAGLVVA